MKRIRILFGAVVCGIFLLTACAPSGAETAKSAEEKQEQKIEHEVKEKSTETEDAEKAANSAQSDHTNEIKEAAAESEKKADEVWTDHGALRVQGTDLVDEHGNPFQLFGMSTHGIAWFPQYINPETFRTLRDDWNTNCIRLAMYTDEYGGYCSGGNKEELKTLIKNGVEYASELGMYVIVDWHVLNDQDPNVHIEEAKEFFQEMSACFQGRNNVLYEICNEPNSTATWEGIKTYAEEVIPVIRANDADAVIIVGTPTWSQEIDQALASPLAFDNVMYALHFYAATHTDWLRERLTSCVENGLPVFVSEFGTCDASGNGANDFGQTEEWLKLLEEYQISFCCWNLANKEESSSVIKTGCEKLTDWSEDDLSESGKWIRNYFRQKQE